MPRASAPRRRSTPAAAREPGDKRTGTFTSGIVAIVGAWKIALFFTGWKHAGENIADVLKQRARDLPAPIQMSDALSRNRPKLEGVKPLEANCLAHGRRQFVDVVENFPEECRYVLETLRGKHPVVDWVLDYRELSKLKSTYLDALPLQVNPETGRVHTSYNQTGSVTGRIASSDPNLQNIPIRTELGRQVRKAFVAASGQTLVSVDYSQVELRIAVPLKTPDLLWSCQAHRANLLALVFLRSTLK